MCGIVSIAYGEDNPDIGKEAAALLRRLEYRGYDSTGASFIDGNGRISLMKKVGSPTRVCKELGVERWGGRRFIGQVRWATYGAVTDLNSQPHHVRCKLELVGAHNGNVSNTDSLKPWLGERGHQVVSENDGEIVVHLVEERYAANRAAPEAPLAAARRAFAAGGPELGAEPSAELLLLIVSAREADALAEGSYAAAVADPRLPGVVAMKSGSSLYAGLGRDARGEFVVVSSDLSSVLMKTRYLIPLAEGEGIWFSERDYLVFPLAGELRLSRPKPRRSKLDVRETALDPRHKHFMEQEIAAEPAGIERVARYFFEDPEAAALAAAFEGGVAAAEEAAEAALALGELGAAALAPALAALLSSPAWRTVSARAAGAALPAETKAAAAGGPFASEERALLDDLAAAAPSLRRELALLDALLTWRKRREVSGRRRELLDALRDTNKSGGRVFLVASGTSHHAALVAATFFDSLAGLAVYPCNPGQFRSMYLGSVTAGDLVVAISQSGETKDLVDVLQDAARAAPGLRRASLVNNENSRIPQELSDVYLPILCGPEIAVAATKSFASQLAVLYALAAGLARPEAETAGALRKAGALVARTLVSTEAAVEEAARRLFLRPSLHILGAGLLGLAREGALKVREVVLCHAEGYDAAEFKHGPNTILGKNTLFSADDIAKALALYREAVKAEPAVAGLDPLETLRARPEILEGLFRNYPLVFVCPPDEREVKITVSQIHTHKIRGADVVVIAEPSAELAAAASGRPAGDDAYWSRLIELPATGDPALFAFTAAAVLQRLSYRMSVLKTDWLDALGVADHGVHPDVPKNVSKSITVD
ncbi:MAG: SIS domain-containing protein [Spirochaetaceae bacterium]|nr:SIS domain-containing protein [Spirochaetaceae bacterium]